MNSIGFKIKRLREQKSVSQEQLAYELDISQSNLSRIENGTVEKLDFLLMQKVCDVFDVDADYFLEDKIVQTNTEKAIGNIYSTVTINNSLPEDFLGTLISNQEQITKLIDTQNKLIERLLGK